MTAEELQEYIQGDTVRLPVRVQDPSGVSSVIAYAYREGTETGATPPVAQELISLGALGAPALPQQGSDPVDVMLQGMVSTQVPGVYICEVITAEDTLGNSRTISLDSPRWFRIVEGPQEDREGLEVLEVGDFS